MKLNKKLKHKWLKALRSGEYKQGKGHLKDDFYGATFCCLGVLCEVSKLKQDLNGYYQYKNSKSDTKLPRKFRQKIGMTVNTQSKLISMNDDEPKTFDEIAKYISRNL